MHCIAHCSTDEMRSGVMLRDKSTPRRTLGQVGMPYLSAFYQDPSASTVRMLVYALPGITAPIRCRPTVL